MQCPLPPNTGLKATSPGRDSWLGRKMARQQQASSGFGAARMCLPWMEWKSYNIARLELSCYTLYQGALGWVRIPLQDARRWRIKSGLLRG